MTTKTKVPRASRWSVCFSAALAVVTALTVAPQAHAFPNFLPIWQGIYPASTTDEQAGRNGCQTCHGPQNDVLNAYGNAIRPLVQGGTAIGTAIGQVENLDSDGNGDTNLAEITFGPPSAQPGWTSGQNPLFDTGSGSDAGTVDPTTIGVQPPLDPVVGNQPPVAVDDTYSTAFQTQLTVAAPGVLGNDSDPDGDAITAVLQTGPANGTLEGGLNSDGSFTYTPDAGFSGPDSFTYVANDGTDNSNIATVTINVAAPGNTPPVAVDDNYNTPFQTVLNVAAPGVLGNDTDADGDPLTAIQQSNTTNGVATLNADGSFTYTPNAGFSGQDSFTYLASDGTDNSNLATVT